MPVLTSSDEGALMIDPHGDILFTTSRDVAPDGRVELILARPGQVYETGALDPDKAEKLTSEIGTVLRIRMDLKVAIVLQEALSAAMVKLAGMPERPGAAT